ncbi:hypothetical protein DFJ77DRAFT_262780 [Powellomyces hirtus]|nr:hypothetical protein DFJ77DRAFT_262780 [Powellomyces hirtus]
MITALLTAVFLLLPTPLLAAPVTTTTPTTTPPNGCHVSSLRVVVFGDSYTDTGNVKRLTNGTWPTDAYDAGRFSNGPLWTETLTRAVPLTFAYGGATTDNTYVQGYTGPSSSIAVPDIQQQVETYLASGAPAASLSTPPSQSHFVYVVQAGANDYFFNRTVAPARIVGNVRKAVERLMAGAAAPKHGNTHRDKVTVILPLLPDLSLIPYWAVSGEPAGARTAFRALVTTHNTELRHMARSLRTRFRRTTFLAPDFYTLSRAVVRHPHTYGFANATHACFLDRGTPCDDFVWVDAFHPTAKMHALLATTARRGLAC